MKKHRHVYLALMLSLILGIHEGKVALWKDGAPEPVRVFPCPAALLPADARAALKKGIPIESLEQLEALAENYLS